MKKNGISIVIVSMFFSLSLQGLQSMQYNTAAILQELYTCLDELEQLQS